MDSLVQASQGEAVAELINRYYEIPEVQGFALGVHGNFISLYRSQYGRSLSINEILKDGKTPTPWPGICKSAGFSSELSPIYVVIYMNMFLVDFQSKYEPPTTIGGDTVVLIEQIEPYHGLADRSRHRPQIMGGISVSNALAPAAGTLGGFVQDNSQIDTYALSCSHVLWDSAGSDVIQQGTSDGGSSPADVVGTASYNVPLQSGTGFSFGSPFNTVDAALAKISSGVTVSAAVRLLGPIISTLDKNQLSLGDDVVFIGKESDSQDCRIFRYIARLKVNIQGALYNFGDVFEIESQLPIYVGSLSKDGDSGSWVVRDDGNKQDELCGLLFAGNTTGPNKNKAICCFIENVFSELESQTGFPLVLL